MNGRYGDTAQIVNVQRKKLTALTSDSRKRKLIDAVEDMVEDAMRDASETLHESKRLTDGEVAKARRDQEDA